MQLASLAMLNETFSVIFKHRAVTENQISEVTYKINGLECDVFGSVDNGDFRDYSMSISSLISTKLEGKETFICFANGDFKVFFSPFDFQLQSGFRLLRYDSLNVRSWLIIHVFSRFLDIQKYIWFMFELIDSQFHDILVITRVQLIKCRLWIFTVFHFIITDNVILIR